jgi:phosphatidylglycerophosphatase A
LKIKKAGKFDFSDKIIVFIATGAYVGYFPFSSGILGSLWGIVFYYLFLELQPLFYVFITFVLFFVGIQISDRAEKVFGKKDDGKIVIDEISGMMFSLIFIPKKIELIIAAFVLFRIFDILKPIKKLEKIKGGMGIMADDLLAGILTNVLLQIYVYGIL